MSFLLFLFFAYVYSSKKLEKREEQVLPGSEGDMAQWGVEMAQTMYVHMNK
jgi:hypothetical protein